MASIFAHKLGYKLMSDVIECVMILSLGEGF